VCAFDLAGFPGYTPLRTEPGRAPSRMAAPGGDRVAQAEVGAARPVTFVFGGCEPVRFTAREAGAGGT
jgi:hypothetical protein